VAATLAAVYVLRMTALGAFYMHNMTAGWWLLTTLIAIALWGAAVWITVSVVRSRRVPPDEPLAILDRRLAVGEISVEEYEDHRRALAGEPAAVRPDARPAVKPT
jgi:uncharacterized membrane protein